MKVLVIGRSTRNIVCSAKRAGYTVYALDKFGDIDLYRCADKVLVFRDTAEKRVHELAESLGHVDAVILGVGFEKMIFHNTLNNPLKITEYTGDKLTVAGKFKSWDIPHPETVSLMKASGLEFPLMVKPRFGSGGILNTLIKNEEELSRFQARNDASLFIAQEFVRGVPCSISLIGTGDRAAVVAFNEQLIGIPWLTRMPFAYCGNVTPFHSPFYEKMKEYTRQIAIDSGLFGSNGVDFIVTDKGPVVIEVNPRFQGSLDTIELSTGINVFHAHVRSFAGELPERREPFRFAARAILFADKKMVIDRKISDNFLGYLNRGRAADIPQPGSVILPDEPITTLLEIGENREYVLESIKKSSLSCKGMSQA